MPLQVLVVDNDQSFRTAITTLLQAQGFSVSGYAANQGEALAALARASPDAVLLDLYLDGPNGLATLRALREANWLGPVLLTSSDAEAMTNSLALELGAEGFVPKEEIGHADLRLYFRSGDITD